MEYFGEDRQCCVSRELSKKFEEISKFEINELSFNRTEKLYKDLAPYGLLQFVRSGRISVTKEPLNITEILNEK
mgnify:CR=1 FL=1